MDLDNLHEASNQRLLDLLPEDQIDSILREGCGDIDESFLGFVGIYERLSHIIPTDWTVVDLGCAYAPQAFFFADHKEYIGVDFPGGDRFSAPNTTHYEMPIREFIEKHAPKFNQQTTFAICSYVPSWESDNMRLARDAFMNVFTYYPGGLRSKVSCALTQSMRDPVDAKGGSQ